jgi:hypothetical protein
MGFVKIAAIARSLVNQAKATAPVQPTFGHRYETEKRKDILNVIKLEADYSAS